MQVPIKNIIVKKRIRQDMGDIPGLAESLKQYGQINPIMISKKNVLVSGGRRLEAAKYLGWKTVNAVVVDITGKLAHLEYEIEENIQRRDFSNEEVIQASQELNNLKNPGFFRKLWNVITGFLKKILRISDLY
jgi:ParB family chromosome partitioning protein